MKILVTGANGFVGSYVVKQLLDKGYEVFASSRTAAASAFNTYNNYHFIQLDITDVFAMHDAFEFSKPDIVIHCGAMSKPDDCELNQAAAYDVNVFGTVQLLLNAAEHKSFFIFLSTDFIFNGKEGMCTEDTVPDPVNYYGKTKLEAEEAVKEYEHAWAIVRTVFVYGKPLAARGCFLNLVKKKLQNKEPFKVVNDQLRTPTHAADLAKGIALIIEKKATGIFNLSGKDILTPYEMAIKTAGLLNYKNHGLTPVTCQEFTELAKRPLKGGLNINKAREELGYEPMNFENGLRLTVL